MLPCKTSICRYCRKGGFSRYVLCWRYTVAKWQNARVWKRI